MTNDPFNVDPARYDQRMLDQMGLPGSGRQGENLADVIDRAAGALREFEASGAGADTPPDLGKDVSVTVGSPDGSVEVDVSDGQITELRIDAYWQKTTPEHKAREVVVATINAALREYQKQSLALLTSMDLGVGKLLKAVGELQADAHRAYMNDLGKATQVLDDMYRRNEGRAGP